MTTLKVLILELFLKGVWGLGCEDKLHFPRFYRDDPGARRKEWNPSTLPDEEYVF